MDFSGNTSLATIRQDLSNPTVTTHLLKTVQENLLIFETPEIIYEFSELIILDPAYLPTTTTTTISGTTTTTTILGTTTTTTAPFPGIDLSQNFVGQYITATLFGIDSTKLKVGDVVKINKPTNGDKFSFIKFFCPRFFLFYYSYTYPLYAIKKDIQHRI